MSKKSCADEIALELNRILKDAAGMGISSGEVKNRVEAIYNNFKQHKNKETALNELKTFRKVRKDPFKADEINGMIGFYERKIKNFKG